MQSPANIRHAGAEYLKLPVRQQSAIENELHLFFGSPQMKSAALKLWPKLDNHFVQ